MGNNNMAVNFMLAKIDEQAKEISKLHTVADELAQERDGLLDAQAQREGASYGV